MRCQGFQNQLSVYADGELERPQREALERHLRVCAACRADLHSLSQTVSILREMPPAVPSRAVQQALAQKIRSVRQPMSWMETLRLQWRAAGLAAQARAWGVGMAATLLLLGVGAATKDRWQAQVDKLSVGFGYDSRATEPANEAPVRPIRRQQPAPAVGERQAGSSVPSRVPGTPVATRLKVYGPLLSLVVGEGDTVYLRVDPEQDLEDAEVILYPVAGVTILGNPVSQSDGSYLLRRGPIPHESSPDRWVAVDVYAAKPGLHTLRFVVRQSGHIVAQTQVPLTVGEGNR